MKWMLMGLMACSGATPAPDARVTGSVVLPEGASLPEGTTLEVRLEDVSRMDAPAEVLGRVESRPSGAGPFPFDIAYEPERIDDRHSYGMRARIEDGAGKLLYTNTSQVPVLTRQAPSTDVLLPVEAVARPARPLWVEPHPQGEARFRGQGNEPGWSILLFPGDRIDLTWDTGAQQASVPWPDGVQTKERGQVIRSTTEAHDVSVAIWKETCNDTMADKAWGWRVELTLDGKVMSGCGDLVEE